MRNWLDMATTFSKEILFTFTMPPDALPVSDEAPEIKVDTSGSDMVIQAILLRILPCLTIQSTNHAADFIFSQSSE